MERVRALAARLQRRLRRRAVPARALPGRPPTEPDRCRLGALGTRLQHRRELRHEHELAELRRRVDDEPSHPDGGADGAELRLRRGRDRRRRRSHAGSDPEALGDDRKLLGRPDPRHGARAAPRCARARPSAREPGRRPEPARPRRGPDRRGRDAVDLSGSDREPGGDQGARDEWRRDRKRELRAPVREPDRLHESPRELGAACDPVRARACLRPARRRPPAGVGAPRGDVRALDRLGRPRDGLRARRQPADRRERAQHGGKGGALRRRRLRSLRRLDHGDLDGCGDLLARQLHVARRRRPAREHDARRGLPGRRGRGALRDPHLRLARRLHRRLDGGQDARVPGEEGAGGGDEARRPLPPRRPRAHPRLRLGLGPPRRGEGLDPQPGSARPLRGRLRLHLGREQQRLRLRRAERKHRLVQHDPRARHARRALPSNRARARHRRLARAQADRARHGRDVPDRNAALRRAPRRRRAHHGRAHLLPGARPRARSWSSSGCDASQRAALPLRPRDPRPRGGRQPCASSTRGGWPGTRSCSWSRWGACS